MMDFKQYARLKRAFRRFDEIVEKYSDCDQKMTEDIRGELFTSMLVLCESVDDLLDFWCEQQQNKDVPPDEL